MLLSEIRRFIKKFSGKMNSHRNGGFQQFSQTSHNSSVLLKKSMHVTGGFTVIELLITIGVYIILMGAVLASYRTFNHNSVFANASEDMILALRQAQVYGVGTRVSTVTCGTSASLYECSYGVHFDLANPNGLKLFADIDNDRFYTAGLDIVIQSAQWLPSISLTSLTCGAVSCDLGKMNVTFNRPVPDAFITGGVLDKVSTGGIILTDARTGKTATLTLTSAGQISLK